MQICQTVPIDTYYTIADYGSEVMKVDENGRVYVYYTGPNSR